MRRASSAYVLLRSGGGRWSHVWTLLAVNGCAQKKAELVTWLRRTLVEVFPGRVDRSTIQRGSRREDEAGI